MKRMLCPNCYTYNRTTQFICTLCETDIHAAEELVLESANFKEHQSQLKRQHSEEILSFLKNDYYGDQAYYWHTIEPVATSEACMTPVTYRFAMLYYIGVLASMVLAIAYMWFTEINFQMSATLFVVVMPALLTLLGGTLKNMKIPCDITLENQAIKLGKKTLPWHKIHFMGLKKNDKTGLSKVQFEIWYGDDLSVTQMLLKDNGKTAEFVQHLKQNAYKQQIPFAELITEGHVTTV